MAISGGCRWIQLRMKEASDEEVAAVVKEVSPMCRDTETILILDDRVELVKALEEEVSGVHVGKRDMPPAQARELLGGGPLIGVTANTAEDILALKGVDVDYIGLGPYRFTRTKKGLSPTLGTEGYRRILSEIRCQGIDLPVVAIGGITLEDVPALMAAGVDGIAVSGAIIAAHDPEEYVRELIESLNAEKNKRTN